MEGPSSTAPAYLPCTPAKPEQLSSGGEHPALLRGFAISPFALPTRCRTGLRALASGMGRVGGFGGGCSYGCRGVP